MATDQKNQALGQVALSIPKSGIRFKSDNVAKESLLRASGYPVLGGSLWQVGWLLAATVIIAGGFQLLLPMSLVGKLLGPEAYGVLCGIVSLFRSS